MGGRPTTIDKDKICRLFSNSDNGNTLGRRKNWSAKVAEIVSEQFGSSVSRICGRSRYEAQGTESPDISIPTCLELPIPKQVLNQNASPISWTPPAKESALPADLANGVVVAADCL
ncbi:hypothetical protein WAI453_004634 [Rhynchosporium graminicola]